MTIETLMIGRISYKGDGTEVRMSNRELAEFVTNHAPAKMSDLIGKRACFWAGAPGVGRHVWEVTRIDEEGIWGQTIKNTIRI